MVELLFLLGWGSDILGFLLQYSYNIFQEFLSSPPDRTGVTESDWLATLLTHTIHLCLQFRKRTAIRAFWLSPPNIDFVGLRSHCNLLKLKWQLHLNTNPIWSNTFPVVDMLDCHTWLRIVLLILYIVLIAWRGWCRFHITGLIHGSRVHPCTENHSPGYKASKCHGKPYCIFLFLHFVFEDQNKNSILFI